MNYEGFIPLFGGIYVTLLAFGYVNASKSEEKSAVWRDKYGKIMRICGPITIVFGIILLLNLLR